MHLYESTTASHDLDALLSVIADDAVYLFSNQSCHIGKARIADVLRKNFTMIEGESYRISKLTWLAESDHVAVCAYEFAWSGRIGGKPAAGGGRGTTVLRRVDGAWRVAHEHLSAGKLE